MLFKPLRPLTLLASKLTFLLPIFWGFKKGENFGARPIWVLFFDAKKRTLGPFYFYLQLILGGADVVSGWFWRQKGGFF